ncbi:penicillin acylase family protein [Halobacteriovorax sp. HLS]|uniref:penicillin acylase family protein n=1 Tax=Halobacteriovorax sp. HLS TaxID=2234000 RepID=UPI0013E3DBC6|nr:penicillin acylase family protein [Halobacteriovorax sp. HLS]
MIKLDENKKEFLDNKKESYTLNRRSSGITEISTQSLNTSAYAQAMTHCNDRFVQIFLLRIIGQGRISELLNDSTETNEIDKFMRKMNFYGSSKQELSQLDPCARAFFQSYCDGINDYLKEHGTVWEFKLLKVKPEKWNIEDSLMIIKIMSYIGLAQTQQDAQKLIIQLVRNNVDLKKIKSLFSPHLDTLNLETIEDLKKLKFFEALIPEEVKFLNELPKFMASNNWILSGKKTNSGNVIQCNDPHLEVNRLPAIWYEQIIHTQEGNFHGMTMPGIPGIIMGRSENISFGFTYGFMDMVDYFIEDIKEGKFLRDSQWEEFNIRKEVIKKKGGGEIRCNFFENSCGTVEAETDLEELPNGKFLNLAWSCRNNGAAASAKSLYELYKCKDVHSLKEVLSHITISCNWLLGDIHGNIAYQQSGQFPNRKSTGLYPLKASDSKNLWNGMRPKSDLLSVLNPECGFLATANNDLADYLSADSPLSINLPMGPYRYQRIKNLLESQEKFDIEQLKKMQSDLYSLQAELFMQELSPYLGDDSISSILKTWNFNYDRESQGAIVFEHYYFELLRLVFAKDLAGTDAWDYIANKSSILVDFYYFFDTILLEGKSPLWFAHSSKEDFIQRALENTKKNFRSGVPKLKDIRRTPMKNILFDGKLPNFLGFDYGPITIEGSRATIVQGALYEAHGRISTFCPSMRFVCDLGDTKSYTVLAGGVSDRRFSKLYTSEVEMWLNYKYKSVELN